MDKEIQALKQRVYEQNIALASYGLAVLTWGNVSGVCREKGIMAIKPSGVPYAEMKADDMVLVSLESGEVIDSEYRPSSDTPTHLYMYRTFPGIGGAVHTHSLYAVAWAQAGKSIPAFGTTHADAFYGDVPVTRALTKAEIEQAYEANTGKVIAETFSKLDYEAIPAVLVKNHGPFTWGPTPEKAVENAVTLEFVARAASETLRVNAQTERVDAYLLDKHYFRKHGKNAYYGQKKK